MRLGATGMRDFTPMLKGSVHGRIRERAKEQTREKEKDDSERNE